MKGNFAVKKRRVRMIFLFLLFFLPFLSPGTKKGFASSDFSVKNFSGTVQTGEKITKLYDRVFIDSSGNLVLETSCPSGNRLRFGFHTCALSFRLDESGGTPHRNSEYYDFFLTEQMHIERYDIENERAFDTYFIPMSEIVTWLSKEANISKEKLMEESGIRIYINTIFRIKYRDNEMQDFLYSKNTYDSLIGIQNAPADFKESRTEKGWYDWSSSVRNNFTDYFDAEIVIRFHTSLYEVKCFCVEENEEIDAETREKTIINPTKVLSGEEISVHAESSRHEKDEVYQYAGYCLSPNGKRPKISDFCEDIPSRLTISSQNVIIYFLYRKETKVVSPPPEIKISPIPTKIPTKTPTKIPDSPPEGEQTISEEWYFTTDQGYTIENILMRGDLKIAFSIGGNRLNFSELTKRELRYSVGYDDNGNSWYFHKESNNATYVHPKTYKGINTEQDCRLLTELTFPSRIYENGVMYTVKTIGGSSYGYQKEQSVFLQNQDQSYVRDISYAKENGYFLDYQSTGSFSDGGGSGRIQSLSAEYLYGVVGTGYVRSEEIDQQYSYSMNLSSFHKKQGFQNYYVYNTTLKSITIPDTVTKICSGAFYGCQSLVRINGGKNLSEIGEMAFAGGAVTVSKLSHFRQNGSYYRKENYFFNESSSYSEKTVTMRDWETKAALSEEFPYPKKEQWSKVTYLGKMSFSYHNNLTRVELAESVQTVEDRAFAYSDLLEIHIFCPETFISENSALTLGSGSAGPNRKTEDRTFVYAEKISTAAAYVERFSDYYLLITKEKVVLPEDITERLTFQASKPDRISFSSEEYDVKNAVPGTESVSLDKMVGSYRIDITLRKRTIPVEVSVQVTVPFRIYREQNGLETMIEQGTVTVPVTRMTEVSYWEYEKGGLYLLKELEIQNEAISPKKQSFLRNSNQKPNWELTSYGEKENHIVFDYRNKDGVPEIFMKKTSEVKILLKEQDSYIHAKRILAEEAEKYVTEIPSFGKIRNDLFRVEGITVLDDHFYETNQENAPNAEAKKEIEELIPAFLPSEKKDRTMNLNAAKENGTYLTIGRANYQADQKNKDPNELLIRELQAEPISIHTPVVCDCILSGKKGIPQGEIPSGSFPIVLHSENFSSFFVRISNQGKHCDQKGYGERDYEQYCKTEQNEVRNEICFPIPVYLDVGNDFDQSNDQVLTEHQWYLIGNKKQRFYLSSATKEGSYTIRCRSVAENGYGKEEREEQNGNLHPDHYVATAEETLYVIGSVSHFCITDVCGEDWDDEICRDFFPVTLGCQEERKNKATLPLREGTHPLYRNKGPLRGKDRITILLQSTGSAFLKDAVMTLQPVYVTYEEGEYREVSFIKPEEILLKTETDSVRAGTAALVWKAVYTLPEQVTKAVENHPEQTILLLFRIKLVGTGGITLYYGDTPDKKYNESWVVEAGESERRDAKGSVFRILGGETAIISSVPESEYHAHGVY